MASQNITCDTIGLLAQGEAGRMINDALREAQEDMEGRTDADKKPRKLTITLTFTPMSSGAIDTGCKVKLDLPAREATNTIAQLRRQGGHLGLLFSDGAPEATPLEAAIAKAQGAHQGEEE